MHNAPIRSVAGLVQELLRHRDPGLYADILARYGAPTRDLGPYLRWNARHYTRTCIHRSADIELLAICYEPGQRTSVHDYDSQSAWVHAVTGKVVEERFITSPDGRLQLISEVRLQPGRVDKLGNGSTIHRFSNRGTGRAITLNLYAKPMSKWRVYDERTGGISVTPAGPPE